MDEELKLETMQTLRGLIELAELVGHMDKDRYQTGGQVLIHQNQMHDCAKALQRGHALFERLKGPPITAVYKNPVRFTVTNKYGCGPKGEDDVYTVQEWLAHVEDGSFVDYDGSGHPVKDKLCDPKIWIFPSQPWMIPADATHIVWYNR